MRTEIRINFGRRAERFAMRPPEEDATINILEGSVRAGKTFCLHPKRSMVGLQGRWA